MDTIELLAKFADPEVIKTLSLSDRLLAGLITTLLGMGITFVSLVILQFVIGITARFAAPPVKPVEQRTEEGEPVKPDNRMVNQVEDEEIVAAITTALALQLQTSASNIVIRTIEKVDTSTSSWQRAGIREQVNNSI